MKRIKFLIRKEFQQIRRDRAMLAIIFVMPIIQLLLLGYVLSSEVRNISTVICDQDNSSTSRELTDLFRSSGYFHINYYENDPDKLTDYLDSGKALVAVVFPKNMGADLLKAQPVAVQVLVDGQDANSANITQGYIAGILQHYAMGKLTERLPQLISAGLNPHLITAETRVWFNPDLEYSDYMVPGIIVFLLTIVTAMLSAMGLVREREIGTLEQLMVTPLRKTELLIGKVVPFAILGLVELTLALVFAKLWYHIPIRGNLLLFAVFALVYLFSSLGVGLFISAVAHTQQQALFMAWFFLVFLFLMSGFAFPIENMPPFAQYISYLNPMRYMIVVVREIFIKGAGLHHLLFQGAALLVFSGTIFSFAVLRFQQRIK